MDGRISACANSCPNVRRRNFSARRNAGLWVPRISVPWARKTSALNISERSISERSISARNSAVSEDSPPCSGARKPAALSCGSDSDTCCPGSRKPAANDIRSQRLRWLAAHSISHAAPYCVRNPATLQHRDWKCCWKVRDSNELTRPVIPRTEPRCAIPRNLADKAPLIDEPDYVPTQ